jgi:hypothetical protein
MGGYWRDVRAPMRYFSRAAVERRQAMDASRGLWVDWDPLGSRPTPPARRDGASIRWDTPDETAYRCIKMRFVLSVLFIGIPGVGLWR